MKTVRFDNEADFEYWSNQTWKKETQYILDDRQTRTVEIGITTECKKWTTAARRFCKAFENVKGIESWVETMKSNYENGIRFDCEMDKYKDYTEEEIEKEYELLRKTGTYEICVEQYDNCHYCARINLSGMYRPYIEG